MYEEDGRVGQSCNGVMSVLWVLSLLRSRTPVEVEEEIGLGGNFPMHYHGSRVGREGRDGLREVSYGRVYLWRRADEP